MAGKYTYKDFEIELANSGLAGEFSDADMKLAQQNPDAGMSLLSYKKDYHAATTDEARALAHEGAQQVRSSHGEYTSNDDGTAFYLNQLSPNSFQADPAPTYTNRYDGQIQDLLGQIINREDFSYDPEQDQLYSQYRKQYTREGQRATQDALGAAAAASGGIPSSYAATAASQAGDYYASQMTDKIPELYQIAYNKYLNDYSMKQSDLAAVQSAEQSDYNKYLNDLSQYNTDRSFNYGVLLDEIESQRAEKNDAVNMALIAAENGDYSFLNALGINTDNVPAEREWMYQLGALGAEYGDYTGLEKMGITPNGENIYNFNAAANGRSAGGSGYSGGGNPPDSVDDDPPEESGNAGEKTWEEEQATAAIDRSREHGDPSSPKNDGGKGSGGKGANFNSICSTAKRMRDTGRSTAEIMAYLNRFNEHQLTDEGMAYILNYVGIR